MEHSFVKTAKLQMDNAVLTVFGQTSLRSKSALLSLLLFQMSKTQDLWILSDSSPSAVALCC